MSRDWFDPFGLRGSRLDPFTLFTDALKGQGPTGQPAGLIATTLARRLVGRTVHVDAGIAISATIEAVDEVRPPPPMAALPTGMVEVPVWQRIRVQLRDVEIGPWRIDRASLDVRDVRLAGASAQAVRVAGVEFTATVAAHEVTRWAAAIGTDHRVRLHDGRLEVSDRRVARWAWVAVQVTAAHHSVVVTPETLTAFGRSVPLPERFRRPVRRDAPWLPAAVGVDRLLVAGDEAVISGRVGTARVAVDMAKLLVDIGTEGTMSALRVVTGER